MSDQTQQTAQVILVPVLLFIVFLVLLWAAGILTFTDTAPSEKIMAAALALVGAFIGSTVSFAGIVLKHSINVQTERRLALESARNKALQRETERRLTLESERNVVLQREAENRLKLEAAIRAVQLLATSNGDLSPPIQRAGSLLTLASLGQHDLTIALTSELFPLREIDAQTASQLIHRALLSHDEHVQRQAIELLHSHAENMLTSDGLEFPACLLHGFEGFSPYVREWGAVALGSVMVARSVPEWSKSKYMPQVQTVVAVLSLAWETTAEPELKNEIGAILAPLLRAFPNTHMLHHPKGDVDTDKIRSIVKSPAAKWNVTAELVARLDAWAGQQPEAAPS
jgi:hypothetical protein